MDETAGQELRRIQWMRNHWRKLSWAGRRFFSEWADEQMKNAK